MEEESSLIIKRKKNDIVKECHDTNKLTGFKISFYEIESVVDLGKIKDCGSDVFITIKNVNNFKRFSNTIQALDFLISGHRSSHIYSMDTHEVKALIYEEDSVVIFNKKEKVNMHENIKNDNIKSYKVHSMEEIEKINDPCEIRIMIENDSIDEVEKMVDLCHKKWPNNMDINDIPIPGGMYIMIPESIAKKAANSETDEENVIKAYDANDVMQWKIKLNENANIIINSIFSSNLWNYDNLMNALNFIIESTENGFMDIVKPNELLDIFEIHGLQSINLIYWGLRLNAYAELADNAEKTNKMQDVIFHACDILANYTKESFRSPVETVFDLIHYLADDKKDENGDFIDINYEFFGIYGLRLMHYLKGPQHMDFTDEYDHLIDSYRIITEGQYSADAWDIIYKNYIDIYKARHGEIEPDSSPLFDFANSFREWIIFSEIFEDLGYKESDTEDRYRYYQICMNKELYNAIYLNINSMQISDFLVKYEYQVYCAAKSDENSMQIEPMLILLLRFYKNIYGWKNYMASNSAYVDEVKNFNDTLDFLIKNCKSKYLGYLAKRFL